MAGPTIAFICPTCGHFDYAIKAIRSFLKYTPDPRVIIVDDASPDWDDPRWRAFVDSGRPHVSHHRFRENGGVTRSWNWGIRRAIDMGAGYVIAGNSDILFCEGWYRGLVEALESGHALAGPISNAPGPTSRGKASITAYYPGFRLVDDLNYLNYVSGVLRRAYLGYHVADQHQWIFPDGQGRRLVGRQVRRRSRLPASQPHDGQRGRAPGSLGRTGPEGRRLPRVLHIPLPVRHAREGLPARVVVPQR